MYWPPKAFAPTEHEIEVLRAWIDSGSAKAAAEKLNISERTVERHLENLRHKCECHRTGQVVALAYRNGWLLGPDTAA
jgi:DNA-binding CsgD family transcriptional regulator